MYQQGNHRLHFIRAVHFFHPYRHSAGGQLSHGHRQRAQKIW